MNNKKLIQIKKDLEKEDEYDTLVWGSKDTIRDLLKYICYLKRKNAKLSKVKTK